MGLVQGCRHPGSFTRHCFAVPRPGHMRGRAECFSTLMDHSLLNLSPGLPPPIHRCQGDEQTRTGWSGGLVDACAPYGGEGQIAGKLSSGDQRWWPSPRGRGAKGCGG